MTKMMTTTKKNAEKTKQHVVMQKLLQIPVWIGTSTSLMVHTVLFIIALSMPFWTKIKWEDINLALTTAVSLEAIYLSLFIQISVNQSNATIAEIQEDVEEIQEDVEEIQGDVEELQEDVEGIQEEIIEDDKEENEAIDVLPASEVIANTHHTNPANPEDTNQQILRELREIKAELNRLKNR
jgi:TolA-binding protein